MMVATGLFSCRQATQSTPKAAATVSSNAVEHVQNKEVVYTKYKYADAAGKQVIIENGFPKGGNPYTDPNGNAGGYAVFWTRIINETDQPLALKLDFPINSYAISNFPGKYFKVLVPADTMTPDKIPLPIYGLTDIASFLDANFNKPTSWERTINPRESSGFCVIMLILTEEATGMTRAELSLQGQNLTYKIARYSSKKPITLIDEIEIPCGSIDLKNLKLQ
jgi:hypothetical protein